MEIIVERIDNQVEVMIESPILMVEVIDNAIETLFYNATDGKVMAREQVIQLLTGETYSVLCSTWTKVDPESERTVYSAGQRQTRYPLPPLTATVFLYDYVTSVYKALGSVSVGGSLTGATATITDNVVSYTIPASMLTEGTYRVYIYMTFSTGEARKESLTLQVSPE